MKKMNFFVVFNFLFKLFNIYKNNVMYVMLQFRLDVFMQKCRDKQNIYIEIYMYKEMENLVNVLSFNIIMVQWLESIMDQICQINNFIICNIQLMIWVYMLM